MTRVRDFPGTRCDIIEITYFVRGLWGLKGPVERGEVATVTSDVGRTLFFCPSCQSHCQRINKRPDLIVASVSTAPVTDVFRALVAAMSHVRFAKKRNVSTTIESHSDSSRTSPPSLPLGRSTNPPKLVSPGQTCRKRVRFPIVARQTDDRTNTLRG